MLLACSLPLILAGTNIRTSVRIKCVCVCVPALVCIFLVGNLYFLKILQILITCERLIVHKQQNRRGVGVNR